MAAIKTLDQEIKAENRKVSGWLLYVDEREQQYLRRRETAVSAPSSWPDFVGGGRGNDIGDPTAERANAAYRPDTEAWIALVREVEARLPLKMQVYLQLRRKYRRCIGRRGWVSQLQAEFASEMRRLTGKDLELVWVDSRTTFYVWWDRIVEYTARLAAKRGLLQE